MTTEAYNLISHRKLCPRDSHNVLIMLINDLILLWKLNKDWDEKSSFKFILLGSNFMIFIPLMTLRKAFWACSAVTKIRFLRYLLIYARNNENKGAVLGRTCGFFKLCIHTGTARRHSETAYEIKAEERVDNQRRMPRVLFVLARLWAAGTPIREAIPAKITRRRRFWRGTSCGREQRRRDHH